jgi:hypothetical protein
VSSSAYLGSVINDDSSISEGTTHGIKKGNRAYYGYKGLMTSKLINKYSKRTIRVTLIKLVVKDVCKTWTLSVLDMNNLLVL